MLDKTEADTTAITVGVIDDAYCAWFTAESACEMALRDWFSATGEERERTYLAYVAALDCEEASARDLARRWDAAPGSASSKGLP
jgi:hypothetical protein